MGLPEIARSCAADLYSGSVYELRCIDEFRFVPQSVGDSGQGFRLALAGDNQRYFSFTSAIRGPSAQVIAGWAYAKCERNSQRGL
jgi:hypothetical protein